MTHEVKVKTYMSHLETGDFFLGSENRKAEQGLSSTPNSAGGVTGVKKARGFVPA